MSRESVQKKIQRRAKRRAARKLPAAEVKESLDIGPEPSDDSDEEVAGYSDEFLAHLGVVSIRANPDGSSVYFSNQGQISQDEIDEALEQWRESQGEESE